MKYILITISAMLMSCASKPAKDTNSSLTKSASSETKTEMTKPGSKDKTATKSLPTEGQINCVYGDIKRELKIVKTAERCTVEYTKDGATQEIGTGAPNSSFCAEIAERVKNNLAASGYKCE